jgi:hypothetical protein
MDIPCTQIHALSSPEQYTDRKYVSVRCRTKAPLVPESGFSVMDRGL